MYYISRINGYIFTFRRFIFLLSQVFHQQIGQCFQIPFSSLCRLHPYLLYVCRSQYSVFQITVSVQYSFDEENFDDPLYLSYLHFPSRLVGKDQALFFIPTDEVSLLVYFTKQLQYDCRPLYSVFCLYHFHCVLFHEVYAYREIVDSVVCYCHCFFRLVVFLSVILLYRITPDSQRCFHLIPQNRNNSSVKIRVICGVRSILSVSIP